MLFLRKAILLMIALLAQQAAQDKNFKPVEEMTGADTLLERRLAAMLTTEREWVALWREHREQAGDTTNLDPPPRIDFKKYVVLAYFGGSGQGVDGYQIVNIDSKGKTNLVRIAPHFMANPGVLTNSYGFWVFPRPKKTVELELLTGVVDGEPQYQKVGKFEAPKDQKPSEK